MMKQQENAKAASAVRIKHDRLSEKGNHSMKMTKIIGAALAAVMAFGAMGASAVTSSALNGAKVISNSEYTVKGGFVMAKDKEGDIFVKSYKGKGGAITIPEDAVYIADGAFSGKKSITSVTVPKTCWGGIGNGAFSGCVNLKTLDVKGDIECVGENAFFGCISLKTVIFRGDVCESEIYGSYYGGGIFDKAFYCCSALESVIFTKDSSTLSCIGSGAFGNCLSLSKVTLPHKVSNIYDAFYNCPKLLAVSVPWRCTVDRYAFGYIVNFTSDEPSFTRVTGSSSANAVYYTYDSSKNSLIKHYKKITPKKMTMVVEKGTDAERYAKRNRVKYKYRLNAPESVLASRGKDQIDLTWNWINGADYYIVYLYNPLLGKYEEYEKVKGESCTITGLHRQKKYRFKIAAIDTISGTDIPGFLSDVFEFKTR